MDIKGTKISNLIYTTLDDAVADNAQLPLSIDKSGIKLNRRISIDSIRGYQGSQGVQGSEGVQGSQLNAGTNIRIINNNICSVYDCISNVNEVFNGSISPYILYKFNQLTSLTFTLESNTITKTTSVYNIIFSSGSNPTVVNWPTGLLWVGGITPLIEANATYEISICDNLAVCVVYK